MQFCRHVGNIAQFWASTDRARAIVLYGGRLLTVFHSTSRNALFFVFCPPLYEKCLELLEAMIGSVLGRLAEALDATDGPLAY